MSTREFSWKTIDGLKIYGKYWAPENGIKGVVCLVHGMGEHINRYEPVGKMLTDHGYALVGFDHRGHGQSEGKRGHTPTYDHLLNAVDDLLNKAQEFFPETPQVLYGHSMGGGLVLNYAIQWQPQIAGVIASSPWLKLAFEPPKALVAMAKVVNRVWPTFSQSTKLDAKAISRDLEVVRAYENDPLVHDKITSAFYLSAFQAGLWALDHAHELHLPLLLFHGTEDRLTSHEASKAFAQKVEEHVTFKLYQGGYHELHNDLCKLELFELMINWLDTRIGNEEEE